MGTATPQSWGHGKAVSPQVVQEQLRISMY